MLGVRVRVLPSFFLVSAILAFLFVGTNPVGIVLDVACIFVAILFTEVVQALVYKSYGLRSTVLIREFGGGVYPEHEPPTVLQRITAQLASPASSFLLFALVYYSNQQFEWAKVNDYTRFVYFILWLVSLFWGIIGLLPIFPYPGGRVLLEVLNAASPRNGLVWTLAISIVAALAYVAYTAAVYFRYMREIPLVEGVVLPASIFLSVFLILATTQNWQLFQYARAMRRGRQHEPVDDYGDRAPWER
jgi:hypothetical protein